jgi:hypothetical protein
MSATLKKEPRRGIGQPGRPRPSVDAGPVDENHDLVRRGVR